jgi:membrane protease YdiL (CAAX protease family)
MKFVRAGWAMGAELTVVGIIVCYGSFSIISLVLLLLLASQSLWNRGLGWSDLGLRRPVAPWRTILYAVAASVGLLLAIRIAIVPFAVFVARERIDLSVFGEAGDTRAVLPWLAEALTLSAFGEEMVFRGYLIRRVSELTGNTSVGRVAGVVVSSALFGLAHRYQGWAGVIATAMIGATLATLYLCNRENLWTVIVCHGIVDAVILSTLYFGHSSLLFP